MVLIVFVAFEWEWNPAAWDEFPDRFFYWRKNQLDEGKGLAVKFDFTEEFLPFSSCFVGTAAGRRGYPTCLAAMT